MLVQMDQARLKGWSGGQKQVDIAPRLASSRSCARHGEPDPVPGGRDGPEPAPGAPEGRWPGVQRFSAACCQGGRWRRTELA